MQTKKQSLIESGINIGIGVLVSWFISLVAYPLFNLNVSVGAALEIVLVITVFSFIRSYYVRRFFNWFNGRR